jgi:hypothetical protein
MIDCENKFFSMIIEFEIVCACALKKNGKQ